MVQSISITGIFIIHSKVRVLNELKRGKNSNFKFVFGWLHYYHLPQRLNSTFFEKFLSGRFQKRTWSKEIISKTLILAFVVIVKPPKHTFEIGIFSIF